MDRDLGTKELLGQAVWRHYLMGQEDGTTAYWEGQSMQTYSIIMSPWHLMEYFLLGVWLAWDI